MIRQSALAPVVILAAALLILAASALVGPAAALEPPPDGGGTAARLEAAAGEPVDIYLHQGLLIVVAKEKADEVRRDQTFGAAGWPVRVNVVKPEGGLAVFTSDIIKTTVRVPLDRVVFWGS